MGISGLLPQLKSITRRRNVSEYAGQIVAVDAYCLLHRGAYSCARELVEGLPTDRVINFCMARIDLLLRGGVTPLVVFDGDKLPMKEEEEHTRECSRLEAKERARTLWQQGNKNAANDCYQRAVDITPAIAKQFIEALKQRGLRFIVAPYEADAQLAFLARSGAAHVVLTEDSDLLAYGSPVVFFKMDRDGWGEEVALADLPSCRELSLVGWTHELFQEMCAMAGCDFVKALPGIGIKKAHAHIRRTRDFRRAVRALRFDGVAVPVGYEAALQRALWTFRHQRVYCPALRATVPLSQPPGGALAAQAALPDAAALVNGEPDFLGPELAPSVAQGIAEGNLDPISKLPFGADPAGSDLLGRGHAREPLPPKRGSDPSAAQIALPPRGAGVLTQQRLSFLDGLLHGTSHSARKGFKKPRLASEEERQGDPPQRSAAAAKPAPDVGRFFPVRTGPVAEPARPTLRTTLWAALQAQAGEGSQAEEGSQDDGEDEAPSNDRADSEASQEQAVVQPPSLRLGTWGPQPVSPPSSSPLDPDRPQLQPPPAGVTPGFYADCYLSDGSPGRASLGGGVPGSPADDSAALPASRVDGEDRPEACVDPIADLSHLPAVAQEAKAAVDAAMERAMQQGGRPAAPGPRAEAVPVTKPANFTKFAFRS